MENTSFLAKTHNAQEVLLMINTHELVQLEGIVYTLYCLDYCL